MAGFTVWFTGLPCSGKSTLARKLADALSERGLSACVLDGDELRQRLCRDLGFSKADRDENIRRIAFVCKSVTEAGGIAIVCAISPYAAVRAEARLEIGRFVEVFTDALPEACERRDIKGMWKKARKGEIQGFTGVDDPYEPPETPEVHLLTDEETEDVCVERIMRKIESQGYLPSTGLISPHGGTLIESRYGGSMPARAIELDPDRVDEAWNLCTGAFSPLDGFAGPDDLEAILATGRLANALPWTIPVVLPMSDRDARDLGDRVTLKYRGKPFALLTVADVYEYDKEHFARRVFGTTDERHPGVAKLAGWGDRLVAGPVARVEYPDGRLTTWTKTPQATRDEFAKRGWRTVVAFQTRNIPHLGHEWAQRSALAGVDGLLIQPLAGSKKSGEFTDDAIFAAYDALVAHYYDRSRTHLAALHLPMHYAGPREAIFHAIIRKNFGCSHFIVGRDHAGVGDFYEPFAAHKIFEQYPDIGVVPLRYGHLFHCRRCGGVSTEKSCGHAAADRLDFTDGAVHGAIKGGSGSERVLRPEVAAAVRAVAQPFVP